MFTYNTRQYLLLIAIIWQFKSSRNVYDQIMINRPLNSRSVMRLKPFVNFSELQHHGQTDKQQVCLI